MSNSRIESCERTVFLEPDGTKKEGLHYITNPSRTNSLEADTVAVYYHDGLIHRQDDAAVIFQDGHKEEWKNGVFVRVLKPAFCLRTAKG